MREIRCFNCFVPGLIDCRCADLDQAARNIAFAWALVATLELGLRVGFRFVGWQAKEKLAEAGLWRDA